MLKKVTNIKNICIRNFNTFDVFSIRSTTRAIKKTREAIKGEGEKKLPTKKRVKSVRRME